MPTDYKKGKIYCIRSHQTDEVYVGSTTQSLSKRLAQHRTNQKRWVAGAGRYTTSFDLLQHADAYIELLELYPCSCKAELHKTEGKYIREMDCVNKMIAGRTHQQYYKDNKDKFKQYYKENKDRIKHYRKDNKDKIKQYKKQYYKENKDRIKHYRKDNKDKIKQYKKQEITCSCGSIVCRNGLRRHERTNKHKNKINSLV